MGTNAEPVRAVGKAMELLELLHRRRGPMSLQELALGTGYPKSTVHALLTTLRAHEMVRQLPDGRYGLGIRLFELGSAVAEGWDVAKLARPFLEQLAQIAEAGSFLAIPAGDHALTIDHAVSGADLQVAVQKGVRFPLHATSQGKLFLSAMEPGQALRLCQRAGLQPFTRHTLVQPEALLEELERTRQRGYGVEDGEYRVGLRSVAAPVYDRGGNLICAMGVVGLFGRVGSPEFDRVAAHTCRQAGALSAALGSGSAGAS